MITKIGINDLTSLNKMASNFNLNINEEDLKKENDYYIGYIFDNKLVGFAHYTIYYERAELNYIFVLPEYRNNSIATKMLNYIFNNIIELENITLEVRMSNKAAIKLYEKSGFKKCAIRKNYYGKEDAIMMIRKFGDNNE